MGEGSDQDQRKGKDKKKDDDDNQSLTGYSSQPGEDPVFVLNEVEFYQIRTQINPLIKSISSLYHVI